MADIDSTAAATAMRQDNVRHDDPRTRAAEAAMRYDAGPIATLSIDQTRALAASVSWTQSGGDASAEHRLGFVGQYMLTPGQLARAGFLDPDRLADAMGGYRSEWKWASDGGTRPFLGAPGNWRQGLDLHTYRGSEQLQNASFRAYCEDAYGRARERGVLDGSEKGPLLAGYLKVHTVMGEGPADAAITGGRKFELPGRDSNYRLLHHLSRGLDGMEPYLAAAAERVATQAPRMPDPADTERAQPSHAARAPAAHAPAEHALAEHAPATGLAGDLRLDQPTHPDHPRFNLAREMVQQRFGLHGEALDNAAAVATHQARSAGLDRYGEILPVANGAWVIDTHRDDPAHHRFLFEPEKAAATPLAETSRAYNQAFEIAQTSEPMRGGQAQDVAAIEPVQRGLTV